MLTCVANVGKIMTNFERTLRGFDANLCCKCCLDMIKDLDHVFRFCIKVRLFFHPLLMMTTCVIPNNFLLWSGFPRT